MKKARSKIGIFSSWVLVTGKLWIFIDTLLDYETSSVSSSALASTNEALVT